MDPKVVDSRRGEAQQEGLGGGGPRGTANINDSLYHCSGLGPARADVADSVSERGSGEVGVSVGDGGGLGGETSGGGGTRGREHFGARLVAAGYGGLEDGGCGGRRGEGEECGKEEEGEDRQEDYSRWHDYLYN